MQKSLNHRSTRAMLFLAVAANVTGQSFLFMILPGLGRRLGISDIQTGAILSVSALLLIGAAPFWGWMSERLGRRRILRLALTGSCLGALAYATIVTLKLAGTTSVSVTLTLFFTARILQALLVGGVVPSAQAFMADITTPSERINGMGLIGGGYAIGGMSGALAAWSLAGTSPALGFAFTAMIALLAWFAIGLTTEPERRRPTVTEGPSRLRLRDIGPFIAITLLCFLTYSVMQQVMGLRLQDTFGYSPEMSMARSGTIIFVAACGMAVMQGWGIRRLNWPPLRLIRVGSLLAAFSMMACGIVESFAALVPTLAIFGMALGMVLPGNLTLLSLRADWNAQGKAAGVNMIGQAVGLAIGPLMGAALYGASPLLPFLAAMAFMIAVCIVTLKHRRFTTAATPP